MEQIKYPTEIKQQAIERALNKMLNKKRIVAGVCLPDNDKDIPSFFNKDKD